MAQTTRELRPFNKVFLELNSSPELSQGNIVCLMGFVDALHADYAFNTPIDVGVVSSVAQAVAVCDRLGLAYKFDTLTTLDLAETDELAGMLIQASLAFEQWIPYKSRNTLASPSYVLCALDESINSKEATGGKTPFGNFFTIVKNDNVELTTIVPSYEFVSGDSTVAGNYFSEIRAYTDTVIAQGLPLKGWNYPIFHMNISREYDLSGFEYPNLVRSSTIAYYQDLSSTSYQVPVAYVSAVVGMVTACLASPYLGLTSQNIGSVPLPASALGYYSDDDVENMLRNGISPILADKKLGVVQLGRIVTSELVDPSLGVARANMLDMQDWKKAYEVQRNIWNAILFNKNIIGENIIVDPKTGSSPILTEIKQTILGVLTTAKQDDIVLEPVEGFLNILKVYLNPKNFNQVINDLPIYTPTILYQSRTTVSASDPATVYTQFAIQTGEQ